MKNFLKQAGKMAYNIKTAPIRAKAKVVQMGANAVGAKGVANLAGKIAKPLNKGGKVSRYGMKHGGEVEKVDGITDGNKAARREYMKGGQVHYAHGEMPKAKAN